MPGYSSNSKVSKVNSELNLIPHLKGLAQMAITKLSIPLFYILFSLPDPQLCRTQYCAAITPDSSYSFFIYTILLYIVLCICMY